MGALRLRRGGGGGGFGSPSHPRPLDFIPQAARHRSSVAGSSATTVLPATTWPSLETKSESIRRDSHGSSPPSTAARSAHGGRSRSASAIAVATRSGGLRLCTDPSVHSPGEHQPTRASRSARTASTIARPSGPSAASRIASIVRSNRSRHACARSAYSGRRAASRAASARTDPTARPCRAARSTMRSAAGSARGFVGGGSIARTIRAIHAAGSGSPRPSPRTSSSRTITPSARSRSTSAASTRPPSCAGTVSPSSPPDPLPARTAAHTEAARGGIGTARISARSRAESSTPTLITGETSRSSCHAHSLSDAIAEPTSASCSADSAEPPAPRALARHTGTKTHARAHAVIHGNRLARGARHAPRASKTEPLPPIDSPFRPNRRLTPCSARSGSAALFHRTFSAEEKSARPRAPRVPADHIRSARSRSRGPRAAAGEGHAARTASA